VNEQLKSLTRDYQSALDFYNNLLAKKSESEMATDLERQQEGEQFRIMDPADLPNEPSFPNRSLFALGGLAIGAALGLGLVVIRELDDKLLRTEEDVAVLLDLPTLVLLPRVEEAGNGSWRRKKQAVERV
ncbi:MAG TPA: GNVR domain-containing protein, partial [Terriglobales bacterium]|nr:GNVR domain-containing protein [Terriglobales bacterium]